MFGRRRIAYLDAAEIGRIAGDCFMLNTDDAKAILKLPGHFGRDRSRNWDFGRHFLGSICRGHPDSQ